MKKTSIFKTVLTSIFLTLLMSVNLTFAAGPKQEIPYAELNIGGITPQCSLEYVESVYGAPTSKSDLTNSNGSIIGTLYNYNNKLFVYGYDYQDSTRIAAVKCKAGNLETPSGFAVGKSFIKVIKKYGSVLDDSKRYIYGQKSQAKPSKEFKSYTYMLGPSGMNFKVNNNWIITEISYYTGQ